MLKKQIFSLIKKLTIKRPRKNFRFLEKSEEEKKIEQVNRNHNETHKNKFFLELLKKKIDVIKIESNLLEKQKIIIKPIRMRHKLDTYDFLTSNNEVPCYINERKSFPNLHFVLHKEQIKQINSLKHISNRPLHILIDDTEILCTLKHSRIHPNLKIHYHTVFERFLENEKNKIKIKVFFTAKNHYKFALKDIHYDEEEIELVTSNKNYPAKIELDFYRILRKEKFTFGDLHNMLPPGLELSEGNRKRMNAPIARLMGYQSKKAEDLFFVETTKMQGFFEEKVEVKVNPLLEERERKKLKRREEREKKVAGMTSKNIKVQMKGEQARLRGMFQEVEDRENARKAKAKGELDGKKIK